MTDPSCAVPVVMALGNSLIALSVARSASEGQQTKTELVYRYLTGPRFRHRIEAIVERFTEMQADLERERKTMMRIWAKREEQIHGVVGFNRWPLRRPARHRRAHILGNRGAGDSPARRADHE